MSRQIVGFDADFDKTPERIQKIVDNGPGEKYYCTDGYLGYVDIVWYHNVKFASQAKKLTEQGIAFISIL